MVLRFASGSVTPASSPRNSFDGIHMHQRNVVAGCGTCRRRVLGFCRAAAGHDRRSTQVSCSPIASWISTAATAESTPPDRPQITSRPLPTWARIFSIASSREGAHGPVALAGRRCCARSCGSVFAPSGVCTDLGVELHRVEFARVVGDHRDRRARRRRRRRGSPSAVRVTRSPWLIHTGYLPPFSHTPSNSAQGRQSPRCWRGRIRGDGRPRPCRRDDAPSPARRSRCRAPAAPAVEDRRAAPAARRRSSTEAGPPERITPPGLHRPEGLFGLLERHDLGIDAHPRAPRRAISWVTCEPKSTIRILSWTDGRRGGRRFSRRCWGLSWQRIKRSRPPATGEKRLSSSFSASQARIRPA